MTWTERVERVGTVLRALWWVLLIVGLVFGFLVVARSCGAADRAEAALVRAEQAIALEKIGAIVAKAAKQKELDAQASQIDALQADIAALRAAIPGIRVVRVERIVTKPAPAEGVPRPPPLPGEPCPQCLFAWGDTGQLRIDSVDLETREGNQVAVVAAGAWRIDPGPETRILAGVGSAPLSTVSAEPLPLTKRPGLGIGLGGGYGTSGPVGSAIVISPPFLWKHIEVAGILTAGPQAGISVQGAIIYRR